jgi:ABC-2 type transport system permease protein
MKLQIALFKMKFMNNLQYRAAALAGLTTQFFFGFVFIMVYLAFYESSGAAIVPMKWQEVVNYLWLNQAFYALTYIWIKESSLISMIRNGDIAYELCRPINFYSKWFATLYGSRLASVTLRFLPVILIAILLPYPYNLSAPASIGSFILFLIALLVASLLVTAIGLIFHLITFFTLDEKGILALLMVISEIFSGGVVPIPFFPKFLQIIANLLPFRFIADIPFRIYSGNINISSAIPDLLIGVTWVIIMLIIGNVLSRKALAKVVVQGG